MFFGTSLFFFFFVSLGIRLSESTSFSGATLGSTVILPVLMAVIYADKISAVKAVSQKTWTSCKISEKQVSTYWILLPHLWGEEQSSVLSWSWRWNCNESSSTNPVQSHRDTNDTPNVFLLFCPTDPDSLLSGFKGAEDYISFVCLLEGRMQGTLFLRSRQGHLPVVSAKQKIMYSTRL